MGKRIWSWKWFLFHKKADGCSCITQLDVYDHLFICYLYLFMYFIWNVPLNCNLIVAAMSTFQLLYRQVYMAIHAYNFVFERCIVLLYQEWLNFDYLAIISLQEANTMLDGERDCVHLKNLQKMLRMRRKYMVEQVSALYPMKASLGQAPRKKINPCSNSTRSGNMLQVSSLFCSALLMCGFCEMQKKNRQVQSGSSESEKLLHAVENILILMPPFLCCSSPLFLAIKLH